MNDLIWFGRWFSQKWEYWKILKESNDMNRDNSVNWYEYCNIYIEDEMKWLIDDWEMRDLKNNKIMMERRLDDESQLIINTRIYTILKEWNINTRS